MEAIVVITGLVLFVSCLSWFLRGFVILFGENFLLALLVLLIFPAIFFIWAVYRGVTDD